MEILFLIFYFNILFLYIYIEDFFLIFEVVYMIIGRLEWYFGFIFIFIVSVIYLNL